MRIDKIKIGKLSLGLFVSGFIFISCHRDSPSWDTQILAPVVNASMSINNIITSSYIKNNPDSTVSLVFTDSLYNLNIDTIVTIPDTVLNYDETNILGTQTINPGTEMFVSTPNPTTTIYPIGSVELTEGILQSGYLIFAIRNPLSQPVDYYYKVLNVIKGTDTLHVDTVIKAFQSLTIKIPLNGYTINFKGPSGNGYNDITTSIEVYLDPSAIPVVIPSGDTVVSSKVSFTNVIPYYAKGYFGTTTKSFGPENVAFPVFNKIVAGTLNLQNVSVNLTLTNGFGVDASLILSKLTSNRNGDTIPLHATGVVGSTIHVNRATATNSPAPASPVNPSVLNFTINPTNSNIINWLDNMPTSIGYSLQVTTDPLGNVSGSNDFAYYGYGISANINVTIPLSLIANNLTLADTLAVNFAGSANTTQHIKSGTLTIYASNGFPFSAGLQLYLLNKNNIVYDSLFIPATQTINAAPVNAVTGIVTNPQSSVLTISLDAAHTQELFNTKNIILHARFNMGNLPSTYRKIYDYYQLGLKLVGNFDYQIN
jgi:hypothetical protein